jgi:tetratricopeptide (TPR) repeat protein
VPKGVRAELHERLAGLLEARAGARVREYEEIVGYHLEQAWRYLAELGPIERRGRELGARAAGRLAAAGRRALARGDTPAATALLDRALAVAPGDDPARGHLLNDLAESLVAAGDFGRADEVLTAATVAAEAGGDGGGLLAQVAVGRLGMRLLIEPGLPLDAIQGEVEAAIAALEGAGDDRGLARAWRLLGYESFMRCRIERAEAALARTIEHARRAADKRVDAYARGMLAAAAFWGPLPVAEGVDRCRSLLALGRGLGTLGRVTSEDPDFQVKAQDSRDALAAAVQAVLAEATEEAGDRPVDPELLATLTGALAAAFDQGR